jgi:uncharacterized protein
MQNQPTDIFIYYLAQLQKILHKMALSQNNNPELLHKSLQPDMLPLIDQVRTAANFSLRCCCPLAKRERISFNGADETYSGLQHQLTATIDYLQAIPHEDFLNTPEMIEDQAGFNQLNLPADQYYYLYALPNFFFHLSMVYAIARSAGIAISKGDFDGFHSYPEGFSFI